MLKGDESEARDAEDRLNEARAFHIAEEILAKVSAEDYTFEMIELKPKTVITTYG